MKENQNTEKVNELTGLLAEIVDVIEEQIYQGKELKEDYLLQDLTLNALEVEGFLRGCITIKEALKGLDKRLNDLFDERK